jgi:hypothetical protein
LEGWLHVKAVVLALLLFGGAYQIAVGARKPL